MEVDYSAKRRTEYARKLAGPSLSRLSRATGFDTFMPLSAAIAESPALRHILCTSSAAVAPPPFNTCSEKHLHRVAPFSPCLRPSFQTILVAFPATAQDF
jgi:hypothetical protein